jgi:hypothetical protein
MFKDNEWSNIHSHYMLNTKIFLDKANIMDSVVQVVQR